MKRIGLICTACIAIILMLTGCGQASPEVEATPTVVKTQTPLFTSTASVTGTPTMTPTPTEIVYLDEDKDGLSDEKEHACGTRPDEEDSDGDSLSDYDEVTKYFTDPLQSDSDGDGIPDDDAEERREYTYTLRAVMQIRQPFDVEAMNDHFQDVVAISQDEYSLKFQVTYYRDAYHILEEMALSQVGDWYDGLDAYLAPDAVMDFDDEMAGQTKALFTGGYGTTDLDVVSRMYQWESQYVTSMPGTSQTDKPYPEPFLDFYVSEDDEIIFPNTNMMFSNRDSSSTHLEDYVGDRDWQLAHLVKGKECFENQTHGSCGSTANFHSTILRSAGIPTRVIQTIPSFDESSSYQKSLLDNLSISTFIKLASHYGYNHFVCEAFIGGRWIRVNNRNIETQVEPNGIIFKVISFASWKDVNFAIPWGRSGRPYQLIEIEEQEAVHETSVINWK